MTRPLPRILLVEDEPLIRMLAVDMLDMLGFSVVEAGTGGEALALSDEDLHGLAGMMVDLGLPDAPGEEVVRQLRARRADLPVIVVTGADAAAARARIGSDQPVGVLEKPYQFKDLESAIAPLSTAG